MDILALQWKSGQEVSLYRYNWQRVTIWPQMRLCSSLNAEKDKQNAFKIFSTFSKSIIIT